MVPGRDIVKNHTSMSDQFVGCKCWAMQLRLEAALLPRSTKRPKTNLTRATARFCMSALPVTSPQHKVYYELPRGRNQLRSELTLFAHEQREARIAEEEQSSRLETTKQERMQELEKTRREKQKQEKMIHDEFEPQFHEACENDDFDTAVDEVFALQCDLKALHVNDEDSDRSTNRSVKKAVKNAFLELARRSKW